MCFMISFTAFVLQFCTEKCALNNVELIDRGYDGMRESVRGRKRERDKARRKAGYCVLESAAMVTLAMS